MYEPKKSAFRTRSAPMSYQSYSYVLPPGANYTVGEFQYEVKADAWHWSDGTFVIHGFEPGDVVPTTPLVLAHKHPEDREAFEELFRWVRTRGGTASSHHRIIDGRGATRSVAMVAEALRDETGSIVMVMGYFLDLTRVINAEASAAADDAVMRAVEKRQFIDQAKGMLMRHYWIDSDAAFAMLSQWSQRDQKKLRTVAEELVNSFRSKLTDEWRTAQHPRPSGRARKEKDLRGV